MSGGKADSSEFSCEEGSLFKGSTVCEVYEKLNNGMSSIEECSDCNTYCSEFNNKKGTKKIYPDDFENTCKKILRNLFKLSDVLKSEKSARDRCSYLSYWTYEQLWKKFTNPNSEEARASIHKLHEVLLKFNNIEKLRNQPCHIYLTESFASLKEKKELHDFFKSFDYLKNKLKSVTSEKEKYCEYITRILELYKQNIRDCCTYFFENSSRNTCEEYLKCEKRYYPYELLSILDCSSKSSYKKPEEFFEELAIDREVILRSRYSNELTCQGFMCDPFRVITHSGTKSYDDIYGYKNVYNFLVSRDTAFEERLQREHDISPRRGINLAYYST
ncbi:PIR protein [Plasmodium brasilianum]|uniref:PIR protein n=1 Tax=Plasmodium brasilianum TaxID=5824 RepID=A0ACB9YBL2_PLABR|nr:PIR protein [Plasmodium brasilianum]